MDLLSHYLFDPDLPPEVIPGGGIIPLEVAVKPLRRLVHWARQLNLETILDVENCLVEHGYPGFATGQRMETTAERLKEIWHRQQRAIAGKETADDLQYVTANEAASICNLTLPEISKAFKAGKIRGRKPTPEQRLGNEKLQVVLDDVRRFQASRKTVQRSDIKKTTFQR